MRHLDARGCAVSGATSAGLQHGENALASMLRWHGDAPAQLALALQQSPEFVMAHAMQAWLLVCHRDPRRVRLARPVLARATALPADGRERGHLAAAAAALDGDYERARRVLDEVLRLNPRDVLALHVAHSFDHALGDTTRLRDRVAAVLPSIPRGLPGRHAVLAMHAFGLEECGDYDAAERAAHAALSLDPQDIRAHHAMAHVFEMSERPDAGLRWIDEQLIGPGHGALMTTHCWWHLALFQLSLGRIDDALALYDRRIGAAGFTEMADLIDGTALLWRIALCGGDAGQRWRELAAAWSPHIDDGFCSFCDLHAMIAFVGAADHERAAQLEGSLQKAQSLPTRHGETTRQIGLPACRALLAFGRGDDLLAITLLASLPALAHRFGGSHAQRDVLHLTLLNAIERIRRPIRRTRRLPHRSVRTPELAPLAPAGRLHPPLLYRSS